MSSNRMDYSVRYIINLATKENSSVAVAFKAGNDVFYYNSKFNFLSSKSSLLSIFRGSFAKTTKQLSLVLFIDLNHRKKNVLNRFIYLQRVDSTIENELAAFVYG
jgi:hypothetical protein